jgi:hypothetical protein
MTRHGRTGGRGTRDAAEDTKWKKNDLVLRLEEGEDGEDELHLYKIRAVSPDHENVSDDALITAQLFMSNGNNHTLSSMVWNDFKACELSDVPLKAVNIKKGRITNYGAKSLVLTTDLQAFYDQQRARQAEEDTSDGDVEDEADQHVADPTRSMEAATLQCRDFREVRSMLEVVVEEAGHLLMLSPKYHAELAGQGIEYDFGRCKWWFRNHNSHSTAGLREKSMQSMKLDVVSLRLTRKYARRGRDYQRAYLWGHGGLEVETAVKKYKCHRAAIDQSYKFIVKDE